MSTSMSFQPSVPLHLKSTRSGQAESLPRRAKRLAARGYTERRAKAFLVDAAVIISTTELMLAGFSSAPTLLTALGWMATPILWPVSSLAYFTALQGSPIKSSLGMRLFGLRIALRNGSRIGYKAALWRTIFFFLSITLLSPLVLAWIPVTGGKRGMHDVLVQSFVRDAE